MTKIQCPCGRKFERLSRPQRRFCSSPCRQRDYRLRQKELDAVVNSWPVNKTLRELDETVWTPGTRVPGAIAS